MILIFTHSAKNATQSSEISSSFTFSVLSFFFKDFKAMSHEEQMLIIKGLSHFVRKLAHFTVFSALGATSFSALCTYDLKCYTKIIAAFGIAVIYAVSDEIHQIFVPGRAGRVSDVFIDSGGALCGILFICIIIFIFKKIRKGKYESRKKG